MTQNCVLCQQPAGYKLGQIVGRYASTCDKCPSHEVTKKCLLTHVWIDAERAAVSSLLIRISESNTKPVMSVLITTDLIKDITGRCLKINDFLPRKVRSSTR